MSTFESMKNLKIWAALYILVLTVIKTSLFCQQQIVIDSVTGSTGDAILIKHAGGDGIEVNSSGICGINVVQSDGTGVYIGNVAFGVNIGLAAYSGVSVNSAGHHGFQVFDAGGNGVYIADAGVNGIYVDNADGHSMNIQGNKNASTLEGHVGLIYNRNTGTSPDVLALKIGRTSNPGVGNNFITFYRGDDMPVGRIEGNGSGGVTYGTSGADFAECLPRLDPSDVFQPGDVVGVLDGRISHATAEANKLMVITDRPAVLGNQPEDDQYYEKVSFIGQVPVRVHGPVRAGDWIVPSGLEDGTGSAIPSSQITLKHMIVGRAWESNNDPGIKRVNTVVGLDHSAAKDEIIRNMQAEILVQREGMFAQQEEISTQKALVESLQEQVDALKHLIHTSQDSTFQP